MGWQMHVNCKGYKRIRLAGWLLIGWLGMACAPSSSALEVWILRHGETTWNRAKILQGALEHPDLTQKGVRMAEDTGEGLATAGVHFDRVYSSPLRRARHTAELVCKPLGIEVQLDKRLQEMNFGIYQGTRYDSKTCTNANLRAFYEDNEKYVPQGPGAERLSDVKARAKGFLETVVKPLEGSCNRVLCVSHGLVLNVIARAYAQMPGAGQSTVDVQRNCSFLILDLQDGTFRVKDVGRVFYDVAKFDAMDSSFEGTCCRADGLTTGGEGQGRCGVRPRAR